METKNCPYCVETILAAAKKCKHCGEWFENKTDVETSPNSTQEIIQEVKPYKYATFATYVCYAAMFFSIISSIS
jgi:tRNA(Ile2) C34 agmatinyltransferase TiaS